MSNKLIDESGKKYGDWTVIGERAAWTDSKRTRWLCRCVCGKEKLVAGQTLRNGSSTSCGCTGLFRGADKATETKRKKRGDITPEAAVSIYLHKMYSRRAVDRDESFDLSVDDVRELSFSPCVYCGGPPSNKITETKNRKGEPSWIGSGVKYNGLDRIDSSVGYTKGNVVAACWCCNRMKRNLSVEDFLGACSVIAGRKRLIEGTILWRKNLASKSA